MVEWLILALGGSLAYWFLVCRVSVRWTIAFVLVGSWPLSFLGRGRAGPALALVGVLLWLQILFPRDSGPRALAVWGRNSLFVAAAPWMLGIYATGVTAVGPSLLPSARYSIQIRVVFIFMLVIPIFIAGGRSHDWFPAREVKWLGIGLVLTLTVWPTAPPATNSILAGHAAWLTITGIALFRSRRRLPDAAVVLAALRLLIVLGEIGPILSAITVAILFLLRTRESASTMGLSRISQSRNIHRRAVAVAAIAIAFGGPFVAWARFNEKRSRVGVAENNSVLQRSAGYRLILTQLTVEGHGLAPIDIAGELGASRSIEFGYAHDFPLDLLQTAGLVGALCGFPLLFRAVRQLLRIRSTATCIAGGLLVGTLFSGGIDTPYGWFALGVLMAVSRGRTFVRAQRCPALPGAAPVEDLRDRNAVARHPR